MTRWVSIALAISMGVAIWKVHYQFGFFLKLDGDLIVARAWDLIVLIVALACLALSAAATCRLTASISAGAGDAAGRARLRGKI